MSITAALGLRQWSLPLRKRALDLGLYGHKSYTRFVILGRSRVGSNLLRGLLNAHSQIEAFGEVFRDSSSLDWDHMGYFQSDAMRSLIQKKPVQFIDGKLLGRYPDFVRAVGFKLFYYHARNGDQASVWPYLRERTDIRIIHLKRRNLLQTHLSRKRAALTDKWVNTSGRADGHAPVTLDYEECLKDFMQTKAWEEESERYFPHHSMLRVHYEGLASDYAAEARTIQDFLGVHRETVKPTTFQQTRQPLSSMIANYDDLKRQFRGTVWKEFFTD